MPQPTSYKISRRRDRERVERRWEQAKWERKIKQAQVALLVMIAEVGPRNATLLLNDALRIPLDQLDQQGG